MAYNANHKKRVPRKQNRLWTETQNTWAVPTKTAGILVFLAALAIAYLALRHSTDALYDEIGKAEQRQEMLEQDLQRETHAWDRMRSQGHLLKTLRDNGIAMNVTPHGRRIAMGGFVRPAGAADAHGATAVAANF